MHEPYAQQSLIQVKEESVQKLKKYVYDLKVRLNSKQVQNKEGLARQCQEGISKRITNWYEDEKLELEVHKVIAGLGTGLKSQKQANAVTNYLMSEEYGDAILEDLQLAQAIDAPGIETDEVLEDDERVWESDQDEMLTENGRSRGSYKKKRIRAAAARQ
ncbi:hypothetical protein L873DRAFT_1842385 [Choiromyces venosus 120613-1]|uniref:Uncharacterized protein n=1 Tax=Choiromyces venosus 120613-1 TaxID=1336337 RepID=A0A3N4JW14_9PEZI|nr:hypothetical protein L873DRAFT_1842385 [Choiromyces venosus 120613-1]